MSIDTINTTYIYVVTAATLTPAMSGTTFICTPRGGGGTAITLPAVSPGLRFRFIHSTTVANAITFAGGANLMNGLWRQVNGTATPGAGVTSIAFTATAVPGDIIDLISDGVSWYAIGNTSVAAGIAFA